MPNPTTAAEWHEPGCSTWFRDTKFARCNCDFRDALDAYARQRVEAAKHEAQVFADEKCRHFLEAEQRVEAFRERAIQKLDQMAQIERARQPHGASISRYCFEDAAAAIRALEP